VLVLALAACTKTSSRVAPADTAVVRGRDGVRVWVRLRQPNRTLHRPRVEVEQGAVEELAVAPDRRAVGFFWRAPGGLLRCRFPVYGIVTVGADEAADPRWATYVWLQEPGIEVTTRLPAQTPLAGVVPIDIRLEERQLPARLWVKDKPIVHLERGSTRVRFELPTDEDGVLLPGDTAGIIHTVSGAEYWFLVGVDEDGSIAATTGFVRNWQGP